MSVWVQAMVAVRQSTSSSSSRRTSRGAQLAGLAERRHRVPPELHETTVVVGSGGRRGRSGGCRWAVGGERGHRLPLRGTGSVPEVSMLAGPVNRTAVSAVRVLKELYGEPFGTLTSGDVRPSGGERARHRANNAGFGALTAQVRAHRGGRRATSGWRPVGGPRGKQAQDKGEHAQWVDGTHPDGRERALNGRYRPPGMASGHARQGPSQGLAEGGGVRRGRRGAPGACTGRATSPPAAGSDYRKTRVVGL